jgi:hypothetical protein
MGDLLWILYQLGYFTIKGEEKTFDEDDFSSPFSIEFMI